MRNRRVIEGGTGDAVERPIVAAALLRSAEVEASMSKALAGDAGIVLRPKIVTEPDLAALSALHGDVIVLDLDPRDWQELGLLTEFLSGHTPAPIVVTSPWLDVGGMCDLLRLGVRHIVPQPLDGAELAAALRQAATWRQQQNVAVAERPKGMVVSFIGSCGGVGTTSLAAQGACALSRAKGAGELCVIDLDIQFGCAALLLDAEPRGNILDLIKDPDRLDGELLRGAMAKAASGRVDLLASPGRIHEVDAIDPEMIAAVIELASSQYSLTILDVPMLWSHWTHAALRASDAIALVLSPTVASVRQGRRQIDMLREEELADIPLHVVANKVAQGFLAEGGVPVKAMETALGRKVDYLVPDSAAMRSAAEAGQPLSEIRGAKALEKKILGLFDRIVGTRADPAQPRPAAMRPLQSALSIFERVSPKALLWAR
jgi:pilus assembly protein CpaE